MGQVGGKEEVSGASQGAAVGLRGRLGSTREDPWGSRGRIYGAVWRIYGAVGGGSMGQVGGHAAPGTRG